MKVCECAGRSASLRPPPPLPAAPESAWSPLSSASSAAASWWSLLSMLVVVITTTNAYKCLHLHHHRHHHSRCLSSASEPPNLVIIAIISVEWTHVGGMPCWWGVSYWISFGSLMGWFLFTSYGFTGTDWNQAWRKPWRERLERLFESYPGVTFQRSSTDWLLPSFFECESHRERCFTQVVSRLSEVSAALSQGDFCFNSLGRGKEEKMLEERLEAATMQWKKKHRSEFVNVLR